MRSVSLKALRDELETYLRLAEGGETVLVTERERVVARLVPPGEERSRPKGYEALADLIASGWVTAPAAGTAGPPPRLPVMPLADLLRDLAEDRSER